MDLQTLRCFLVIAEERSISSAASRMHMSQPPLSMRVKALEKELGVELLARHGRGVELTAAGQLLVDRARRLLFDVGSTTEAVRAVGQGAHGRLSMAVGSTVPPSLTASLLGQLREDAPDVQVEVGDVPGDQVRDRVRHGDTDAGLVHLPPTPDGVVGSHPSTDRVLETAVVDREPMVAVLPVGHLQASEERIDLDVLTGDPLVAPPRTSVPGLREHVIGAWESAGGSAEQVRECESTTLALALVAAGLGVALMPASVEPLSWPGLVIRPLRQHRPAIETAIAWRHASTSPVLRRFLRLALATPEPDMLAPELRRRG